MPCLTAVNPTLELESFEIVILKIRWGTYMYDKSIKLNVLQEMNLELSNSCEGLCRMNTFKTM